jgi:hypothetical protein
MFTGINLIEQSDTCPESNNMAQIKIQSRCDSAESEGDSPNENDIQTATAFLSTTGPCRAVGDLYLTCVATAGLGMCRNLRAEFERCTRDTQPLSRQLLRELGDQLCRQHAAEEDRWLCAADLVNQQLMQGYHAAAVGMEATSHGTTPSKQ